MGYALRYLRARIRLGEAPLPEWDQWSDLAVQGLFKLLVTLPFTLIPMGVGAVLMVPAVMSFVAALNNGNAAAAIMSLLTPILITVALAILLSIPMPMALCRYADTGSFSAAFNFGALKRLVTADFFQYLIVLATLWAAGIVLAVLSGMLQIVPVLGNLAGLALMLFGTTALILAANSAFADYYRLYKDR
jgi:hypothetical protein